MIQFGLETEIGIARDSEGDLDVVAESIALVRSAPKTGVWMRWDYQMEDPHADMRGFRVEALRQDTDEANYFAADARRELSFEEIKSDLVMTNGGRFYNDHAHPEYCTPECSTLSELLAHDRAGELILMASAARLSERRGAKVRLYKNNTDFCGHSYGCHENYLVPRSLPWEGMAAQMQAFLVTRQIYAGAGKFALEEEDRFDGPGFQISQRSDFFSELQSVDTMQRRPIINTRDEPHANPALHRRFHVILGDANMSPFATWLKVGATALTLRALESGRLGRMPELADPLLALRAISRDANWRWELSLKGGKTSTAIAAQRAYLAGVRGAGLELSGGEEALLAEWGRTLDDLERDPMACHDRLDWVAKLKMVREFQEAQSISDDDPWLRSLDLEYHLLDLEEGLYFALEQSGQMVRMAEERDCRLAMTTPPETTRARIRGRCVARFPSSVLSAQWDHVTLATAEGPLRISLNDLFNPGDVIRYAEAVERAADPGDLRPLANR